MANEKSRPDFPPTYIRSVAVRLGDNFKFDNLPHSSDELKSDKPFIGRSELITKFVKMLDSGKGVYLVTGYRGMGKTSFVNKVIREHNNRLRTPLFRENKKKLHVIPITLAQNKPTEFDVLRMMVSALWTMVNKRLTWKQNLQKGVTFGWKLFGLIFLSILFLFLIDGTNFHNDDFYQELKPGPDSWFRESSIKKGLFVAGAASFSLMFFGFTAHLLLRFCSLDLRLSKRLDELYRRCHATVSVENNDSGELSFEVINAKIMQPGGKKTESYAVASPKEIEYELSLIINEFKRHGKLNFAYVFDELDKVEQWGASKEDSSPVFYSVQGADRANIDHLRERRQIIQQIIAGLKNFFTTTEIPFILIAGREMFEASMADIADRQSSISSIFSYVFYIKSLLNEEIEGSNALSKGIEKFLYQLIYDSNPDLIHQNNPQDDNSGERNLYDINHNNYTHSRQSHPFEKPLIEEHVKINLLFQNFVVYLTYRTNGSPKKLTKLIHEFVYIHEEDEPSGQLSKAIIWRDSKVDRPKEKKYDKWSCNNLFYISSPAEQEMEQKPGTFKGAYLLFDYAQQQRIGFLGYLYRPFLVKNGSSFKKYSDNMVVSTSFLFDHLLKFHPFAFSNSHLELIPEVLATNRTPALRDHIKKIIEYLTQNHIKETEIGLFDYKFYNKTVNEIYYLSKTFEEESAAFNFTLDESYLIKLHVISKLKDLRGSHAAYTDAKGTVFSLAYLNGILGDLHFFDQEYDDAIAAYSDVLGTLPALSTQDISIQDFILSLKYKLKLGLTFEKVKSFDESLALYSDAVLDTQKFITSRTENPTSQTISSSFSDIMQIANQAFLATMVLQEKMGVEGITARKSAINIGGFYTLITRISKFGGFNSTIVSNFYMQLGTLLYLKNSVMAFEWEVENSGISISMDQTLMEEIDKIKELNKALYDDKSSHFRYPIMALNVYCLGLQYLLNKRISEFKFTFDKNPILEITKKFDPTSFSEHFTSLSKIHFRYIAIYLSHIGDCSLAMLRHQKSENGGKIEYKIEDFCNPNDLPVQKQESHDQRMGETFKYFSSDNTTALPKTIILLYFLSSYYFEKSGRVRSSSFQLRKILYLLRLVIRDKHPEGKIEDSKGFLDFIERNVVNEALMIASENSDFSNIHDFNKFYSFWDSAKEKKPGLVKRENVVLHSLRHNLSNAPDTREPLLLFAHIKLKIETKNLDQYDKLIGVQYGVSTQYLRLIELTFAAKLHECEIKQKLPPGSGNTQSFNIPDEDKSRLTRLCTNLLHCLTKVIEIIEVYDNDYLVGHSFMAYHYYRLAELFDFDNDKRGVALPAEIVKEAKDNFTKNFSNEKNAYATFDRDYNYGMAASHYEKAIKLHSAGDQYRKSLSDTHYLEDDLNDASYHFGAAMDRYLMVNNFLTEHLENAKNRMKFRGHEFSTYISDEPLA